MGVIEFATEAYARVQKKLLPPGRWRTDESSVLHRVFLAVGDELVRIGGRLAAAVRETVPTEASDLIPEYESELGLPGTGADEERVALIVSRYTEHGRYRPVDYQNALAPLLGLDPGDVEVIEISRADAIAMDDDQEKYRFFVFRDPDLGGSWDVDAAQAELDAMKKTTTRGHVIESKTFTCDDPYSLCDRDLLGE